MVDDDMPQDRAGDEPDPTLPAAPTRATGDVTLILSRIEQGEPQAAEQLLPLVYAELRKLAAAKMAQEKPDQTLQATALVHEAYIRLVDVEKAQHWNSRGHFFGAAAEAMRRILVDNALRKKRPKHGGDRLRADLDAGLTLNAAPDEEILALNEALTRLSEIDEVSAKIVHLKYFAGLTTSQIAQLLGISTRTADRRWAYARAWLHQELCGE
jgi:RNA polymerase sigma factor (TIGR02999 family)